MNKQLSVIGYHIPCHCARLKDAKQPKGFTGSVGLPRLLCMLAMMVVLFVLSSPAGAQEAVPGNACSTVGAFQLSGGPELSGAGHMMVCESGTWKSILSFNASGQITGASNSTCSNGQVLKFNGSIFVCANDTDTGITSETDPQVGTLTATKWCASNAGGTAIDCTQDAPSGGGSIPTCKADMSNIQIGDTCDDGSKFLGSHPNFGWQGFYVTDTNQSTSSNWSNSITLCNNLNRHGHTDWYLPSLSELNHLYENKGIIGGFTTSDYWSSTEYTSSYAGTQYFNNGTQGYYDKSNNLDVRCVRRN